MAEDDFMENDGEGQAPVDTFDIDNLAPIAVPDPLPVAACGDGEKGRLIISHITNINFKSYAGTTVLGPFQKVSLGENRINRIPSYVISFHVVILFVKDICFCHSSIWKCQSKIGFLCQHSYLLIGF